MRISLYTSCILMILLCTSALADTPRAEICGGYSYVNVEVDGSRTGVERGFGVDGEGNVNEVLGIIGTFSANFENDGHLLYYMGGARFNKRTPKATSFAEGLIGGWTIGGDGESTSGLAFGIGAGVDIHAGDSIAVRAFQFDYLPTRIHGGDTTEWAHNFRIQAGLVFKVH